MKHPILLALFALVACAQIPGNKQRSGESNAGDTAASMALHTGAPETEFELGGGLRIAKPEGDVLNRAVGIMGPFIEDDGVSLGIDHSALIAALRVAGEIETADALIGEGEMTDLASAISALEGGLPVAAQARLEMMANPPPPSTTPSWHWWGADFWFTDSTAATAASAMRAGTAGAITLLAGLVGVAGSPMAGVIVASVGAAVNSVLDDEITSCASDGSIGLRVYWFGNVLVLC